ncbi:MAG: hypothetical protein JWR88_940 [Pseudonocardia sp.]|nr:hypothetical protein [Pseudonocardia sp.]
MVVGAGDEPLGAAGRGLPGSFGGQSRGLAGSFERGEHVLAVLPPRRLGRGLVEAVLQVLQLGLSNELLAPRRAQLVEYGVEAGRVGPLSFGGVAGGGGGQCVPCVLRAEVGPVAGEDGLP